MSAILSTKESFAVKVCPELEARLDAAWHKIQQALHKRMQGASQHDLDTTATERIERLAERMVRVTAYRQQHIPSYDPGPDLDDPLRETFEQYRKRTGNDF
jgi:hypothetical protein